MSSSALQPLPPDLTGVRRLVLDAVSSPTTKKMYAKALDDFFVWWAGQGRPPFARATVQAHRAWLDDGSPVVLKVRRPGIREVVEADLRLLMRVAEIIEAQVPDLRRYRPSGIVQQFASSLRAELDFAAECRNAERIAASLADAADAGADVTLFPDTILQGACVVGAGAELGPNTRLVDCVVGAGAVIENTVGRDAEIGAGAHLGPFAVLEPGSSVPDGARPGPFYTAVST